MGNKCTCFNTPHEEHVNLSPEAIKDGESYKSPMQETDHYNTSKAKSQAMFQAYRHHDSRNENNSKLQSHKAVKLQSQIRRFLSRQRFLRLRPSLVRRQLEIKKSFIDANRSQNLNRAEAFSSREYHPDNWIEFYKEDDLEIRAYVKRDYGFLVNQSVLMQSTKFEDGLKEPTMYSGQMNLKKQRHGYGELIGKSGIKFTGHWWEDRFEGWGRYIDTDGTVYEGRSISFRPLQG